LPGTSFSFQPFYLHSRPQDKVRFSRKQQSEVCRAPLVKLAHQDRDDYELVKSAGNRRNHDQRIKEGQCKPLSQFRS